MITEQQKKDITAKLRKFVGKYASQKQACQAIDDASEATIIQMLNNKWTQISDRKWITVAKQIGAIGAKDAQVFVETKVYRDMLKAFNIARKNGSTIAITGRAGVGKTMSGKMHASENVADTFYLQCRSDWNAKTFFMRMLKAMRKDDVSGTVTFLIDEIVKELKRIKNPLFIFDEIDKLLDKSTSATILRHMITLYNELNGHCGFVWSSTSSVETFIKRGVDRKSIGFEEIYSRIGSSYWKLNRATDGDIAALCSAYGITDDEEVYKIINEVKDLNGDLRRFDTNVQKFEASTKKPAA